MCEIVSIKALIPIAATPAKTPMIIATIIINVFSVSFARLTAWLTNFEMFAINCFNIILIYMNLRLKI